MFNRNLSCSIALLLTLFLSIGTACHDAQHDMQMPADGEELPILRQVTGAHSHETRAMHLVIRDPIALSQIPLQDVPVDFSSEMLLIITLGRVTSDQYAVAINRVWREGHVVKVAADVKYPTGQAAVAMASPYCIAVVPRCDLNVSGFSAQPPVRERSWEPSAPPDNW